jgi:hypothetical protein
VTASTTDIVQHGPVVPAHGRAAHTAGARAGVLLSAATISRGRARPEPHIHDGIAQRKQILSSTELLSLPVVVRFTQPHAAGGGAHLHLLKVDRGLAHIHDGIARRLAADIVELGPRGSLSPAPSMLLAMVPISSTSTKGSRTSTIESPDGSRHGPARTRCPRSVHAADSMLLAVVPISSKSTEGPLTSTIAHCPTASSRHGPARACCPRPWSCGSHSPAPGHAAGDGGDLLKVDQERACCRREPHIHHRIA